MDKGVRKIKGINKKKIKSTLIDSDREFILYLFIVALQFKQPKNEFDIDAYLHENYYLFFILCDFLLANKSRYKDINCRLDSK